MKSLDSFGFQTLITVFLPGLALGLGIVFIFYSHPEWLGDRGKAVVEVASKMPEWQQTFAALAIVSLLGSIAAAINGFLEYVLYDKITGARLNLSPDQHAAHWYEYLYRLHKEQNIYVAQLVMAFQFESRMAVAMMIIAALCWYSGVAWTIVGGCAGAGLLFGFFACGHHGSIASYRKNMFDRWQLLWRAEEAAANQTIGDVTTAKTADVDQVARAVHELGDKLRLSLAAFEAKLADVERRLPG